MGFATCCSDLTINCLMKNGVSDFATDLQIKIITIWLLIVLIMMHTTGY